MAHARDYGIVGAAVILFVVLSIASPAFLTVSNLLNLLDQSVTVGILACALTLVIIAGGFDLSIGAIFAVSAIVGAQVTNSAGVVAGLGAALLAGAAMGAVNGALTSYGRLNPFVATIATTMVFRGLALALTGGYLVIIENDSFRALSQPRILGVRVTIIVLVVFALLCMFLLNRTVFGRHLFAAGGNAEAARLAGVHVNRVRATTYVILGVAAGIAAVISASRTLTVDGNTGVGIEFVAIGAVLLGGTSVLGGAGAIWRTLLGVMLLQLIGNGFNLLGVDPTYQRIFTGLVIILAVGWDTWMRTADRR
ncbi:ABC transporter permease [Modestobacter sp. VKM Ac-2978]|uniref:ABC transporter permease n=1 Tax=Modestobacter sp. VKM Ac-2978 TaxID=3004132 RepID=UPI0022AA8245|nr:ABC transporter permease [Modestobacter sp. VKM Ac-2978]MCZ2849913.1 ABC transporter permease [Modestobacter sp. VKM Ac-2978]